MIRIFLVSIFTIILSYGYSQKVYNATNDSTAKVHIVFYEVADSSQADLWVYRVDSVHQVYKEGQWFEINNSLVSLFNYRMTSDRNIADMKIYFVNDPKKAGWRTKSKRLLYLYARRR